MLGIGNKHSGSESGAINQIGSGTTINGEIQSCGDVRIDGTLTGNITLSGRLVIGPNGKIEGNVICQNADISGEIKGKVQIAEMLSLKATAKILGDIATGKISIEAFFKNGLAPAEMKWCSDAKAYLEALIKRYPSSPLLNDAKAKVKELDKIAKDKKKCTS